MAALNQTETQVLRDIRTLLQTVRRNGFVPPDPEIEETHPVARRQRRLADLLEKADSELNTVIQMKGYYPS